VTALFTSGLWGLWHLPVSPPGQPLALTIVQLLLVHLAVGVPLTYAWRRTGNLAYPAAGHALIDAVRNGLMAGL
jgi:membrane protease YdiL (CAAX protease family)